MMVSKIQQWGNSQGLRLPKNVLDLAHIAVGDEVEIVVDDHRWLSATTYSTSIPDWR